MQGHPLYSSKEVRFVFSCGSRTALKDRESLLRETRVQWAGLWQGDEDSQWLQGFEVASETFTMQQKDELQVFTFKEPILCVGGLLKARTFLSWSLPVKARDVITLPVNVSKLQEALS